MLFGSYFHMDYIYVAAIFCCIMVLSGLFSLISSFAISYFRAKSVESRLSQLERSFSSMIDSKNGQKGQEVRKENAAKVAAAEQAVLNLLMQGGITKENIQSLAPHAESLPLLIQKYAKV